MADKRKISITAALVELKTLDSRIMKTINDCNFVGAKKKSSNMVGHFKEDNFVANVKADYQSVIDLISNRATLKSAIVQSNAVTTVEIGGVNYTVAQAIEKKSSIEYDKTLLMAMKQQYKKATEQVLKENGKVDTQVENMLLTFLGKDTDKKLNESDLELITTPIREKNEWELVDPIGIYSKIQELEKEIDEFLADVDIKLSISNAITFIEV
jgi:hypothetical protein